MDQLAAQILRLLQGGRPLKAREIADVLGVSRRDVNVALYRDLHDVTQKDYLHRWSTRTAESTDSPIDEESSSSSMTPKLRIRITRSDD